MCASVHTDTVFNIQDTPHWGVFFCSFAYSDSGGMGLVISWVWTGMVAISLFYGLLTGQGGNLSGGISRGAQEGITLAISLAGSLCLWSGVGKVMEKIGLTALLGRLLKPMLCKVFPSCKTDSILQGYLSGNICANFLGLGNAATPMGIAAAKRLASHQKNSVASNELCRLIVLNTASIQCIPATVAAVRSSLGAANPFDILPAVWVSSLCSAGLGLLCAKVLGKIWD